MIFYKTTQRFLFMILLVLQGIVLFAQEPATYKITENPWPAGLGNHRAVIQIENPVDVVFLDLLWRRHDLKPEWKKFIIVSAISGDTISNIHRIQVDNEQCEIAFGPVSQPGEYYFYYLPFEPQPGHGFYSKNYLKKESEADPDWLKKNKLSKKHLPKQIEKATCLAFEARTEFDSFYPMEVIALASEKKDYANKFKQSYHLFAEGREFPVKMLDDTPQCWINYAQPASFAGKAMKNEYYAFQIALWASSEDLSNVQLEFSNLSNGENQIPSNSLTCFNTDGIDPYGKPFTKRVDVGKGKVQPFWIGIDIPKEIRSGSYKGTVTVIPENGQPQQVKIEIQIEDHVIADRGDSEPWRHSRLRWLNSTAGIDDNNVTPYDPIKFLGDRTYGLTGKELTLGQKGFPSSLKAYGNELLAEPIALIVESNSSLEQFGFTENEQLLKFESGIAAGAWEQNSENLSLKGIGVVESDGWLNYKIKLIAKNDLSVKDIRLEIPIKKEIANYMMGMGLPGKSVPASHKSKWEGPQDSFWIGNTKGGLHCELRGASYSGPLLNLYKPAPPESWDNDGNGGFEIKSTEESTKAIVYSGKRQLKKGEEIEFEFSLIITPVKTLDAKSQFTDRYYHNGTDPWPKQGELDANVKIINVHHANKYNPHINYPFIALDEMKEFVNYWHEEDMKVKMYYTIRELTNHVTEIWALRSLGNEVLGNGRGGGYPWLREHFINGYRPQWYDVVDSITIDASVLTSTGESRWFNYYIEGLKWLIQNVDIDGIYLDDVSFDRNMLKRMRKVMNEVKPGCILDLHSNTGFSKGPAIQYTEFFPYVDKLWFGESFKYDEMPPENWLVEVSGIPFGLMGDMLHGGGNPWRGMVYGMTVRHPWTTEGVTCDPRAIWKVWDDFGIAESDMIGYWSDQPVVNTNNPDVKATAYVKDGIILISVASYANEPVRIVLDIDWEAIGLDSTKVQISAPFIENFQPEKTIIIHEKIPINPKKGWLIIILLYRYRC